MKITNDNQITFINPIQDGKTHYQDILFNDKVIGALCERETSILNPITERYQMIAPETEKDSFEGWYESEDNGFIFGYFNSLEKFIEYYNSKL